MSHGGGGVMQPCYDSKELTAAVTGFSCGLIIIKLIEDKPSAVARVYVFHGTLAFSGWVSGETITAGFRALRFLNCKSQSPDELSIMRTEQTHKRADRYKEQRAADSGTAGRPIQGTACRPIQGTAGGSRTSDQMHKIYSLVLACTQIYNNQLVVNLVGAKNSHPRDYTFLLFEILVGRARRSRSKKAWSWTMT